MAAASQIEALGALPRRNDEWEVGFVSLPGAAGAALCAVCACEEAAGLGEPISLQDLLADPGTADQRLLQAIAALALGPTAAPNPVRYLPSVIRVTSGKDADTGALREAIEKLGVRLEIAEHLKLVDEIGMQIAEGMIDNMPDDDEPLDIPTLKAVKGLERPRLQSFAEAAAAYWRAAPWTLGGDDEIEWQMDPAPSALNLPNCAPMGILGQEVGVGFFFSREEMMKMADAADRTGKLKIPRTLWSVTFEPAHRIPAFDLKLWNDAELPVAAPLAYPVPAGISAKQTPLRPTPVILTEMELVLRALTALTMADVERGEATGEFEVFGGTRSLRLVRVRDAEEESPLRLVR